MEYMYYPSKPCDVHKCKIHIMNKIIIGLPKQWCQSGHFGFSNKAKVMFTHQDTHLNLHIYTMYISTLNMGCSAAVPKLEGHCVRDLCTETL